MNLNNLTQGNEGLSDSTRTIAYSVIIPVLNEADQLPKTIQSIRHALPSAEIIIVDGGSQDDSATVARQHGATVLSSRQGRGTQCNTGGRRASGNIFLFLHADTRLPADCSAILDEYFTDATNQIACFRLRFDSNHPLLRLYGWFTRFDSIWTSFGDQGIVVRRTFFKRLEGFPDWPIFEDVHFLRVARKLTRVESLPSTVTTSARRFERLGMIRCQWLNARLIVRYLQGKSIDSLGMSYRQVGATRQNNARPDVCQGNATKTRSQNS